jgi:hypothetical protein
MPLVFVPVLRRRTPEMAIDGVARRGAALTTILLVLGAGWLAYYVRNGYGSNAAAMLDPIHDTVGYLVALPGRTIVLLTTWFCTFNPFIFCFRAEWRWGLYAYGAAGLVTLIFLWRMYMMHHRGQRGVATMALWVLPFLPLLACTVPDDRVMMLPGIGLSFLAAAWITRPRADGSPRLRTLPMLLFVVGQAASTMAVAGVMRFIEWDSRTLLAALCDGPSPAERGDHVFVLNAAYDIQFLFAQDAVNADPERNGIRVSFLSDVSDPRVQVVDKRTLRISAGRRGMLAGFAGQMGQAHGRPRRIGDAFDAGEFRSVVTRMMADEVHEVELTFRRPLDCEAYRFYFTRFWGPPERWTPPQAEPNQGPKLSGGPDSVAPPADRLFAHASGRPADQRSELLRGRGAFDGSGGNANNCRHGIDVLCHDRARADD